MKQRTVKNLIVEMIKNFLFENASPCYLPESFGDSNEGIVVDLPHVSMVFQRQDRLEGKLEYIGNAVKQACDDPTTMVVDRCSSWTIPDTPSYAECLFFARWLLSGEE